MLFVFVGAVTIRYYEWLSGFLLKQHKLHCTDPSYNIDLSGVDDNKLFIGHFKRFLLILKNHLVVINDRYFDNLIYK